MDIQNQMPAWDKGNTIHEFQLSAIMAVHQPNSSKLPDLLREKAPFRTFMEVMVASHSHNEYCARTLNDAGNAHRLNGLLKNTYDRHGSAMDDAATRPNDADYHPGVVDCLCRGLTCIRAVYSHTSPNGVLQKECDNLLTFVTRASIDSQQDYISNVDNAVTRAITLWGDGQAAELCIHGGALTQLLPKFVARLSPPLRDSSLAYFNARLHAYHDMNTNDLPPTIANALARLRDSSAMLCPEVPSVNRLMAFAANRQDANSRRRVAAVYEHERSHDSTFRWLTVPDDLMIIVEAGVFLTHWRSYITRINGEYSPVRLTPNADSVFSMAMSDPVYDNPPRTEDDPGGFMLAPVTRGGEHAPPARPPPARPPSSGTDPRPFRPRVRIDPNAAERFERSADRTSASIHSDLDKLAERVNTKLAEVQARTDKLQTYIKTHVDKVTAMQDRMRDTQNREQAMWLRTAHKLITNIADQTTDLKHSTSMRDMATSVNDHANKLESRQRESQPGVQELNAVQHAQSVVESYPWCSVQDDEGFRGTVLAVARVINNQRNADSDGFKLTHLPANEYDKFNELVKSVYASRDGVRSSKDFLEKVAERTCVNCAHDQFNMPHREKHCPVTGLTQPDVAARVGQARAARAEQRVKDNADRLKEGRPVGTFALWMDTAMKQGVGDACEYIAHISPIEISPDTDADAVISLAEATAGMYTDYSYVPTLGGY
jgi:hypothetical protein